MTTTIVSGRLAIPIVGTNAYDPHGVCGQGDYVQFSIADISALGKLLVRGDGSPKLHARLCDGRVVRFKISEQDTETQKALRKLSRIGNPVPPRDWKGDDYMEWFDLTPPQPTRSE